MRVRTGITPEAWRDEGPATAAFHAASGYQPRHALGIGSMLPPVRDGRMGVPTNATLEQERRRKAEMQRQRRAEEAPGKAHQGRGYATEEERIAARRATWRASKARAALGSGGTI